MLAVDTLDEIMRNVKTLDSYLESEDEEERTFARKIIKTGACFLTVRAEDGLRFYPCHFIGHKNNEMRLYDSCRKITRNRISRILGGPDPAYDEQLDAEYKAFCLRLGFEPQEKLNTGRDRKFWVLPPAGEPDGQ